MDHPHQLATAILDLFYETHEFIGVGAVLTDGTAGAIESVRLDDDHGLRISIRRHPGFWPVSKLKRLERPLRQLDHHLRFVMVSRVERCEPAANALTN
jgi:hypothetical protein